MTIKSRIGPLATCALQRPVWLGGIRVSLVVGTILNLVNQGPAILAGHEPGWVGLLLNHLIPFCVSVYSGARVAARNRAEPCAQTITGHGGGRTTRAA